MRKYCSNVAFFAVIVLGVGLSGCSRGSSTLSPAPEVSEEYAMLFGEELFQGAHVGFRGETPQVVYAFRAILDHPDGDIYFKSLIDQATMPGQLYGLAGIYYTDPDMLDLLIEPYLKSSQTVKTFFGCILSEEDVSTIAAWIQDGSVPEDLRGQD